MYLSVPKIVIEQIEFSYLVNNAGVMCFGEFEWQTNAIIEHQVNVNLYGTINFTRSFLPLARKHNTRIINVTSHCALEVFTFTLNIKRRRQTNISSNRSSLSRRAKFNLLIYRHCPVYQPMQLRKPGYAFGMMHCALR